MKTAALVLALSTALAAPLLAKGPPWITIEMKPYGAAFLIARTFHHGDPMALQLRGTAEGLVNGRRTSLPLRFDTTNEPNGFALAKSWGDAGVWVINMSVDQGDHGEAGAVIGVDRSGAAAFVKFPRAVQGGSRPATRSEIDALLRALDQGQQPPALGMTGWWFVILRTAGPLVALVLVTTVLFKLVVAVTRKVCTPVAQVA